MVRPGRKVLKMLERTPDILEFGPFRFEPHNGLWRGGEEVPRALAVLVAFNPATGADVWVMDRPSGTTLAELSQRWRGPA